MVPIHTKPPSRDYDDGWDRIFGKKKDEHLHEVGSCSYCDRRLALKELTRLSEEYGGYDTKRSETDTTVLSPAETEQRQDGHTKLPGGGVRHPRGCMCHIKR